MHADDSQLLVVIESLLDSSADGDDAVVESALDALNKISNSHPAEVITSLITYRKHKKGKVSSNVNGLLCIIHKICPHAILQIRLPLIQQLISFLIEESFKCSDNQWLPMDTLVIIGKTHCTLVVDCLLPHLVAGVVPHFSVVYTLGNLATENIHAFLPFVKSTLDSLVTVLPSIRVDYLRTLYAKAISNMAESVVEYITSSSGSIAKETYSQVAEEIYEILISSWLQTKNSVTLETVTKTLASLVLLFSGQKLNTEGGRILQAFLSLYRKSPALPRYCVTLCVNNLLTVAPRSAIQPVADSLLQTLNMMVWIPPDFSQPVTVKNHSEVLRAYDYLGHIFSDKLCDVILRYVRFTGEQDRVVALIVATHLLNSSEGVIKPKISELIASVRTITQDSASPKVNKCTVKMIVALAYKGYLTEGDSEFIEFLIKHSYHSVSHQMNAETSDLENMCADTIYLLSSAIPSIRTLCWRVLLQTLISGEHAPATSVIARSLAYIVTKKDENTDEDSCFPQLKDDSNSVPVVSRVIALLGSPLESNRGIPLLTFLQQYVIQSTSVLYLDAWNKKIQELLKYLETAEWNDDTWEEMLLSLLSSSFNENSSEWIRSLVVEMFGQLTKTCGDEKALTSIVGNSKVVQDECAAMFKCFALLASTAGYEDSTLIQYIDLIVYPIQQRFTPLLKTCARSLGIMSRTQLTNVLSRLEAITKSELTKKSSRFLGLLKDSRHDADIDVIRMMICDCYSQIVLEAPPKQLLPKLNSFIIWIVAQINSAKDGDAKKSCLQTVANISDVLNQHQKEHDQSEVLECRDSLIALANSQLNASPAMPDKQLLYVYTTMFKIQPALSSAEKSKIMLNCFSKMFVSSSALSGIITPEPAKPQYVDLVLHQLSILLEEAIDSGSSDLVDEMCVSLQSWLCNKDAQHRFVAIFLIYNSIKCFVAQNSRTDQGGNAKFVHIGALLGDICVRSFDPDTGVKLHARQCLVLLFSVAEGGSLSYANMQEILTNANNIDVVSFVQLACQKFPKTQLPNLVENLMNGLTDIEADCSHGASQLLLVIFDSVGPDLHHFCIDIFKTLLMRISQLQANSDTETMAAKAVIALAKHHKKNFLQTFLNQCLPQTRNVSLCWSTLPEDRQLTGEVLDYITDLIATTPLYEDHQKQGRNRKNIASLLPLAAVCALKEILKNVGTAELATQRLPELFSMLIMLIATYIGVSTPTNTATKIIFIPSKETNRLNPAKCAYDALKELLTRVGLDHVNEETLTNCAAENFDALSPAVLKMISGLAACMCRYKPTLTTSILDKVNKYAGSSVESQRVAVATYCSMVLSYGFVTEEAFVDSLIHNQLAWLSDTSPLVRHACVKGLASVSNLENKVIDRHFENILSALVEGLDAEECGGGSTCSDIIVEALSGLHRLLPLIYDRELAMTRISIAIRIKPFFEREDTQLRSMSLALFGKLVEHVNEADLLSFTEQIDSNLLCLLFHLSEQEADVVLACKGALRTLSPLLKSQRFEALTRDHLIDEGKLKCLEFITQAAKILVSEFPDQVSNFVTTAMSYTKSTWPEIRASSATFIGVAFSVDEQTWGKVSVKSVTSCLLRLLTKDVPMVKKQAAHALGIICDK